LLSVTPSKLQIIRDNAVAGFLQYFWHALDFSKTQFALLFEQPPFNTATEHNPQKTRNFVVAHDDGAPHQSTKDRAPPSRCRPPARLLSLTPLPPPLPLSSTLRRNEVARMRMAGRGGRGGEAARPGHPLLARGPPVPVRARRGRHGSRPAAGPVGGEVQGREVVGEPVPRRRLPRPQGHTRARVRARAHTHTHTHAYTHARTHARTHTRARAYTHTRRASTAHSQFSAPDVSGTR
jgi:hypothetical protein